MYKDGRPSSSAVGATPATSEYQVWPIFCRRKRPTFAAREKRWAGQAAGLYSVQCACSIAGQRLRHVARIAIRLSIPMIYWLSSSSTCCSTRCCRSATASVVLRQSGLIGRGSHRLLSALRCAAIRLGTISAKHLQRAPVARGKKKETLPFRVLELRGKATHIVEDFSQKQAPLHHAILSTDVCSQAVRATRPWAVQRRVCPPCVQGSLRCRIVNVACVGKSLATNSIIGARFRPLRADKMEERTIHTKHKAPAKRHAAQRGDTDISQTPFFDRSASRRVRVVCASSVVLRGRLWYG